MSSHSSDNAENVDLEQPQPQPPLDWYRAARDQLLEDYNDAIGVASRMFGEYNQQLGDTIKSMLESARRASDWAAHQAKLVVIDGKQSKVLLERIESIFYAIHIFTEHASIRAVRAKLPGFETSPGDRSLLDAKKASDDIFRQANAVIGQVEVVTKQAQEAKDKAQAKYEAILKIITPTSQTILNADYALKEVQDYRQRLAKVLTELGQANRFAFTAKELAEQVHKQVKLLEELIQKIGQIGTNLNLQLPDF